MGRLGFRSPGSPADTDQYAADMHIEKPILASSLDRGEPRGHGLRRGSGVAGRGCTRQPETPSAVGGGRGLGGCGRVRGEGGSEGAGAVFDAVWRAASAVGCAVPKPHDAR